ncbi:hypothetical protein [Streptacidiphilus anmyonensis]|nr:hypothetical protein [Streptacidiphilus anmyonensis]
MTHSQQTGARSVLPPGAADGSWESLGALPDPLVSGDTVTCQP